jgi:hypothetical protein
MFFLLIRKMPREHRPMARQNRDTKAIMNSVQRNRLRSNLFRWMVRHHDSIHERWNGERIDWRTFSAELAELGLTDTKGKPATEGNARETWRQARKVVAKARAAAAAKAAVKPPRPVYPSRIAKYARPENAPPPPGQQAYLGSSSPPGSALPDEEPETYEKTMERLRRSMKGR